MKKKKKTLHDHSPLSILFLCTLLLLSARPAPGALPEGWRGADLVFIYVHGFNENRNPVPFEAALRDFLKPLPLKAAALTYRWQTMKIDLTQVVHQWTEAKAKAEQAGPVFLNDLKSLEEARVPYVIVGYSLGCRVVAGALQKAAAPLRGVRGVYFLGAALPHDFALDAKGLPPGMKIVSYYSSGFDDVLKIPFFNAEGTEAGGEVGFDDTRHFVNRHTVCTHIHKGGPLARDYSTMAPAIGYLALLNEKIFIQDSPARYNLATAVMAGSVNWNDVATFEAQPLPVLLQQNAITGLWRAVTVDQGGKRVRKAWGANPHAILKELGLFPEPVRTIAPLTKKKTEPKAG